MPDLRAWGRARAVGAVDEAERLGCAVVGTEHLLLATLAEPTVRWAFRTVGVDVPDVRGEVDRITCARRTRRSRRTHPQGITADAADAVMHAGDLLDEDDPGVAQIAHAHRELARRFLARTRQSDARDILDVLGVIQFRTRVLATIEHNATQRR